MADYIRREDALKALFAPEMCYAPVQLKIIKELPAADVAEVVRCKDCAYLGDLILVGRHACEAYVCGKYMLPVCKPDDYCSYGERRSDNVPD